MTCKKQATIERNAQPLTPAILQELLTYDPETGEFRWRIEIPGRIQIGDVAGYPSTKGYTLITVRGEEYAAHRLAWLYMTGKWPEDQMDHINRQKADNRWCNLREATQGENMANRPRESFVPRGRAVKRPYRGVEPHEDRGVYSAWIGHPPKYLGEFATAELARDAYLREADKRYGAFAAARD